MERRRGLIDSNVLIAAASLEHVHFEPSARLLEAADDAEFATSVHCLSEFYNGMTRNRAGGGETLSPQQALAALRAVEAVLEVLALSVARHRHALTRFAGLGGTGARVYDFLIGEVAIEYDIPIIVTWNTRHFVPLFPV